MYQKGYVQKDEVIKASVGKKNGWKNSHPFGTAD